MNWVVINHKTISACNFIYEFQHHLRIKWIEKIENAGTLKEIEV